MVKGGSKIKYLSGAAEVYSSGAKPYKLFLFNDLLVLARPSRLKSEVMKTKATFKLFEINVGKNNDDMYILLSYSISSFRHFFVFFLFCCLFIIL